jgi:hypothetical protein
MGVTALYEFSEDQKPLPPSERCVDGPGDERIEVLHEGREPRLRVGDEEMVVIREDAESVHLDPRPR